MDTIHFPELGDEVIVLYDNGYYLNNYYIAEIHPYVLAKNNYDHYIQLYYNNHQWFVATVTLPHIVIIAQSYYTRNTTECEAKHKEYKKICDNLWDLYIIPSSNKKYYQNIIEQLNNCLNSRIHYVEQCGETDKGHIGAIIKMYNKMKIATNYLHTIDYYINLLDKDVHSTFKIWNSKKNKFLTKKLLDINKNKLIDALVQNYPQCVDNIAYQLFNNLLNEEYYDLNNYVISHTHLVYLILKILEIIPTCINIKLLLSNV